jgi:hypothetical protein
MDHVAAGKREAFSFAFVCAPRGRMRTAGAILHRAGSRFL